MSQVHVDVFYFWRGFYGPNILDAKKEIKIWTLRKIYREKKIENLEFDHLNMLLFWPFIYYKRL